MTAGEGGIICSNNQPLAAESEALMWAGREVGRPWYEFQRLGWNYRMTEMQSVIGLAELERMDNWNMPTRQRNAHIIIDKIKDLPQVLFTPIDTEKRRNGWFVMAFTIDIENMKCDIKEFVDAVVAEGAPVWKVFWPQCHTEQAFQKHLSFGHSGFPFKSKEYTNPKSVDYNYVEVPNARWHEMHTFTCFAFPTYTIENCEQIGDALRKVILSFSK